MKQRLLAVLGAAFVTLGMSAAVGDDLTSQYLQNADFTADQPLQAGVCTYAKDVAANGTTLSGMQPVTGWTASNPFVEGGTDIDARAAGVFALGKQTLADFTGNEDDATTQIFLGGIAFPTAAPTEGIQEGNALGLVGVWGAQATYTQAVTLAAGCYTIEIPVYNAGGETAVDKNLFGFIADNGDAYVGTMNTWAVATWSDATVSFILKEQTTGVISLGYKGAGVGSAASPHLFVPYVKILEGDPAPIIKAEADKLKETLAQLIEQGDELGVSTSEAQAVYDDEAATPEQVQAAIDAQRARNEASMTDFTDFFINNAHFTYGQPLDNGVCTYTYDMTKNNTKYFGMQPVQEWTASNPSDNVFAEKGSAGEKGEMNGRASGVFAVGSPDTIWLGGPDYKVPAAKANGQTEGNVFGFISVWTAQSNYTQSVTLPAGSYTITIPTLNGGGTGAVAKNLCGFIADDGTEYLAETTTFPVDGTWHNETIKFTLDSETAGTISIGYKAANAGSAAMPHLFIDEFTLKFNGLTDIDPSLIALQGAVRSGQNTLYSDDPYEATLKSALEEAITTGSDLVDANSADADANTAAATAINQALSNIKASQAVYKKFNDFIEGALTNAIDQYSGSDLATFADQLADEKDTYTNAYENGEYTADQINELIDGFQPRVLAAVQGALETAATDGQAHNLDISILFQNLDFANNTINGWKNETGTSKFLSRANTAEVWNENFNVYQQLENAPAGVYEMQTVGFYRQADNAANLTAFQNGEITGQSYIYVGGNKQLMHNVAEYAATEKDDNHEAEVDGTFLPNSNKSAHAIFTDADADALNTVRGALAEAGTLTIGVKGENLSGNCWTVWGATKIIFKGTEGMQSALYAEVQSKKADMEAIQDDASLVTAADDLANTAYTLADDCSDESSVEDLTAAIKALDTAIAYTKESKKLVDQMRNLFSVYNDYLLESVTSDEPTFTALIEEIGTALDEGFESNEKVSEQMQSLKDGWAHYVQYPVLQSASVSEPADITAAILNPGFEGVTGTTGGEYWDKMHIGGNDFSYQAGVYEQYNADTFDISQSLKGLAEGYYTVKVQGFNRCGTHEYNVRAITGDTILTHAYLYGNEYKKALKNVLERGEESGQVGAGSESKVTYNGNEEFYVPNDRTAAAAYFDLGLYENSVDCYVGADGVLKLGIQKTEHISDDWTPFDNFQLLWLGTTAPDAIQGVETTTATPVAIYTLGGQQVSHLQKGINIVQTPQGVRKVLVK